MILTAYYCAKPSIQKVTSNYSECQGAELLTKAEKYSKVEEYESLVGDQLNIN